MECEGQDMKRQRGQLVMILALIMPLLVLMLAFIVNISLLIHQKIRLQNAIDAGVYSAAASLAADLNNIADINYTINGMYQAGGAGEYGVNWTQSMRDYEKNTSYNGEEMAQALFTKYKKDYSNLIGKINDINSNAYETAHGSGKIAAVRTYYNNYPGLDISSPPTNFRFHLIVNGKYYPTIPPIPPEDFPEMIKFDEPKQSVTLGYVINGPDCIAAIDAGCGHSEMKKDIGTPIVKTGSAYGDGIDHPVKFEGELIAHIGFFPMMPTRFITPPMLIVRAAAQPFGGSIAGLSANYNAALVRIGGGDYYH